MTHRCIRSLLISVAVRWLMWHCSTLLWYYLRCRSAVSFGFLLSLRLSDECTCPNAYPIAMSPLLTHMSAIDMTQIAFGHSTRNGCPLSTSLSSTNTTPYYARRPWPPNRALNSPNPVSTTRHSISGIVAGIKNILDKKELNFNTILRVNRYRSIQLVSGSHQQNRKRGGART